MQPTYLPWIGYFQLINAVDIFIFLDDVQFDKRSWQQRNIINFKGLKKYLTVPIKTKGKFDQKINETLIYNDQSWIKKHLGMIKNSYSNTKYFDKFFPYIEEMLKKNYLNICDLNIDLIKLFSNYLKLDTKFYLSSNLNVSGNKDDKLINLIKKINSHHYISPPGSKSYIDQKKFVQENIKLEFFRYKINNYYNNNQEFVEGLSILDLIFNKGQDSINFI